jgi:ferric-dicitrate binding protein FerR (iron transport regulator)
VESDVKLRWLKRFVSIAARRSLLIVLMMGVYSAICSSNAALAQGVVALVTELVGSATLIRNGQMVKVVVPMALQTNDRLVTESDAHLVVTFGDNSRLELGQSSSIVINQGLVAGATSGITRVDLMGGHLRSIVNAGLRGMAGFEVRTPNAVAGVRGTDFDTAYIAGTPCPGFPNCLRYTDVAVHKGRVEVSNPLNPQAAPVITTAGYETTVPCEEPPATPSPLGMEQMLSPAYR